MQDLTRSFKSLFLPSLLENKPMGLHSEQNIFLGNGLMHSVVDFNSISTNPAGFQPKKKSFWVATLQPVKF
jgi:hypothetical protein